MSIENNLKKIADSLVTINSKMDAFLSARGAISVTTLDDKAPVTQAETKTLPAEAEAKVEETMTVDQLYAFAAEQVKENNLSVEAVQDTLQVFGVQQIADLTPPDVGKAKALLDAEVSKHAAISGGTKNPF